MKMNFDQAFDLVIAHEGGYVDHPDDPGGETNFGITKRVARAHGYDGDMKRIGREEARRIYRESYWDRAKCEQYDPRIGLQLFDAAVNHGIGNAIRMLQRAADVVDDGIVGPMTLAAIEEKGPSVMIALFNAERLQFYARLMTFNSFGRGWTRRVATNLKRGFTHE